MSYQQAPDSINEKGNPPETPPQQQNQAPLNYSQFAPPQPTAVPPQPTAVPPQVFVSAQPQYVQQQQLMVQQPYMGAGGMVMVPPKLPLLPREPQPNDYLVVTLVVTIICGFLNLTSLFFSIPAIVCSVMAYKRRNTGLYGVAKKLGYVAIIMNLLCVSWVMMWGVLSAGLVTGCVNGVGPICRTSDGYYYNFYK